MRTAIVAGDWTIPEIAGPVQACRTKHVTIEEFGFASDDHAGYADDHGNVAPTAKGRRVVAPNRKGQLILRWRIAGWENAMFAEVYFFRWGSLRPIGVESISAANGTRETYGTVAGVHLTRQDLGVMTNSTLTAAAGPYMARLTVTPKEGSSFVGGARRAYFDVLPIAVIGAGAAGLRAAEVLLEASQSVIIIEARDRVGGRACTVTSSGGLPIDLGCQWLQNAPENPLVDLPLGETFRHSQSAHYYMAGKRVDKKVEEHATTVSKIFSSKEAPVDVAALTMLRRALLVDLEDDQKEDVKKEYEKWATGRKRAVATERLSAYDPRTGPEPSDAVLKAVLRARLRSAPSESAVTELRAGWRDDADVLKKQKDAAIEAAMATIAVVPTWETALAEKREEWKATVQEKMRGYADDPHFALAVAEESLLEEGADLDQFSAAARLEDEADLPPVAPIADCEFADDCPEPAVTKVDGAAPGNLMTVEGLGTFMTEFAEQHVLRYRALVTLVLSCTVQKIDTTGDVVAITTSEGALEARTVVVSVPTPIIATRALVFDPVLPARIREAFELLPMAHYKKVILFFSEDVFPANDVWSRDGDEDEAPVDDDDAVDAVEAPAAKDADVVEDKMLFTNHNSMIWKFLHIASTNAVIGFVGGRLAETLDKTSDGAVANFALAALAYALGKELSEIKAAWTDEIITSHWAADALTLGAYSTTAPGGFGSRSLLRSVIVRGRIVFAGEALWPGEYGTLHGAYQSGEVAAKLLLGKL